MKDRAAANMLLDGLRTGALRPGKTILDATSGNTGIAYAMLGAGLGYPVKLCVPANVTRERSALLKAYGAQVVWTDPMDGSDGAIKEARRLYAADPGSYFYADQYNNPNNWRAHFETTGPESLEQTDGRITHFVAGLGTSGTFIGTGRRLRAVKPDVKLISVQPDSPLHGLEGLKHMESAIVPGIYDPTLADGDERAGTEEAYMMQRALRRRRASRGRVGRRRARRVGSGSPTRSGLRGGDHSGRRRALPVRPIWESPRRLTSSSVDVSSARHRRVDVILNTDRRLSARMLRRAVRRRRTARLAAAAAEHDGRRPAPPVPRAPADYLAAERGAKAAGLELIGFYHSHPDHPARPSPARSDHAWPSFSLRDHLRDGRRAR